MRSLSVLLIGCMLFLSFAGRVNPAEVSHKEKDCCREMGATNTKYGCHENKSGKQGDGCGKQNCNPMLSCSVCGFFGVVAIRLLPRRVNMLKKPAPLYIIGNLTAYHSSDWKPPKTC
jgi:hypothetical protein